MVAETSGRVVHLEIENFKSYRGKVLIGPFHDFTTIIGPNGSGKSNVMDAISFVLGVRTAHLRGNLKELLYSSSDGVTPEDRPDHGSVSLAFQPTGGEPPIIFSRAIQTAPDGASCTSQYRIDGKAVSADAYIARLESHGVLVKARNFLVFQGDIENVAQMRPRELTSLIEQVSGSAAHIEEFERAEQEKSAAEEQLAAALAAKRAVAQEKKQRKEERDEAERALALQKEVDVACATHLLWKLFHLEHDERAARAEVAAKEAAVRRLERDVAATEGLLESQRREQAGLAKQRLLLESRELARVAKRARATERELELKRGALAEQEAAHAALRRQLDSLRDAVRQADEEEEGSAGDGTNPTPSQLPPELLAEYQRLKAEAGARVARLEMDRAALASTQGAAEEALRLARSTARAGRARGGAGGRGRGGARARAREAAEREEAIGVKLNDLKKRTRLCAARAARARTRGREALQRRVEELAATTERERRTAEVVAGMRALFPGVHGFVHELADVPDARWKLALAVAMGRDLDAVVVDEDATALACIAYAKEQRVPPLTFLPLASIRGSDIDERTAALPGSARLALHCLAVRDARHMRVFQSIVGGTLVCETVEEARALAFGTPGVRRKVVSRDGTLINRSGVISGGVHAGLEARAQKWDQAALDAAKGPARRRRARAGGRGIIPTTDGARAGAGGGHRARGDGAALCARGRQGRRGPRGRARAQLAVVERERDARAPELAERARACAERDARLRELTARIDAETDAVFAAFSTKLGVASVRAWEETALRRAEDASARRLRLAAAVAKLESQLEHDARVDLPGAGLDKLRAQSLALKGRIDGLEASLRELKQVAANQAAEAAGLARALARARGSLTELAARRRDAEAIAAAEQVGLPPPSKYDYSSLPAPLRDVDPAARARAEIEHEQAVASLRAALARLTPNLRAFEQYEAAAFAHLAARIDGVYKELTRSERHPAGGQAYLALENAEDPFAGGVRFSAMPPAKRFRDMEALSGGEKTVAALALLFAIQSFRPSPFFVLDEVDAALDAANVARVAQYLRQVTRPDAKHAFQGIVISLKDGFYDKADALVGVCRQPGSNASAVFTLDLNAYGDVGPV
ncbi:hypothetical protein QBZ16_004872 [Prototheca wickerhamii]|uniref:SMC hinge domain-containing protein n=1 Tax=Prototheca wickerhamii TaxID=3111 RepID=A0AAD9MKZ4_PROWI|nr:hypothetical protein QBZ16_004872 [Prototheca wickerhamii]